MASIISAGTTSNTALNLSADTTGVLQLQTNGVTPAVTIDTSQNVGIGTASPSATLDVRNTSNEQIRFGYTGTTNYCSLGRNSGTGNFNIFVNSAEPLVFGTNATERMRIDSSGGVGIGTSSISFQTKLAVASANQITDARGILSVNSTNAAATNLGGSISLGGENGQATSPYVFGSVAGRYEGSGYAGYLQFSTTNSGATVTERMRIDSSGNVGIGTNSPSAILDVSGTIRNSAATGNNARYSIYNDATNWSYISYGADAITRWVTGNNTGGTDTTLLFGTTTSFGGAFSERMRLDNNGRLLTPNQSGFFIGFYQPTSVGGLNYMRVNSPTTFWSVGSGLNLTGGPSGSTRYTAPVTGYYLLQWALMGSGSTGRLIGFVERNGAVVTEANSDSVNYANANTQIVINLSAGDYLDFRTSGSYFTSANGGHNMTIRLLG